MKSYITDNTVDFVTSPSRDGIVNVIYGPGYSKSVEGNISCSLYDHGNGYTAKFYNYSVSLEAIKTINLDYDEARNLVLALAEFKKELGFEE